MKLPDGIQEVIKLLAENSTKTANRVPGKPFRKGQSGNPGGRPKKRKELSERCKGMTYKVLDEYEAILDHGKPGDKIEVGKIILAYGYGKPNNMVKAEVTSGEVVTLRWMDSRDHIKA